MDTTKPKPVTYSRRIIRNLLREAVRPLKPGQSAKLLGFTVQLARRFHRGTSGRWNPILVIAKARGRERDAVVMSAEEAGEYLFPLVNPPLAKAA